jgi:hypothetical protein
MSFAEVQQSIAEMTVDERLQIAALIIHLNHENDGAFQSDLDQRMTAMDKGRKHNEQALKARHDDLTKKGR